MMLQRNTQTLSWLFLGLILLAAGALVWLAPAEQTLGEGIRIVYIHVALIWVGMAGLLLNGLVGLAVVVSGSPKLQSWMQTIGWVAWAIFTAGVGTSLLASLVNWGAVFWREPRIVSGLNMAAVALIIQILMGWLPWRRWRGLLAALLAIILVWSTWSAPLILHPSGAVQSSTSSPIRLTFFGLSFLFLLVGMWAVWYLRQTKSSRF